MPRSINGTRHHCGMLDWLSALAVSVILCAATPVFAHDANSASAAKPYIFGMFPHLSLVQLEQVAAPWAEEFSRVLRRRVYFRTRTSFEKFTKDLEAQTYDIALVHPFDYVQAHDKWGYVPLIRRVNPLSGSILVRVDSSWQSLKDLTGKKLGLPPETAAVSYLTKIALVAAGFNLTQDVRVYYYKTHDSCLQQLVIGNVDACASEERPIRFFEQKWNVRFRVLATTPAIPATVFIAHTRVPQAEREALINAMLAWPDTASGRELLQYGGFPQSVRALDAEYDIVRDYLKSIEK